MPKFGESLQSLGFLTLGNFDPKNPYHGHRHILDLIVQAEEYGFNIVQVRNRHLQYGISSPLTILAAASQCTQHISLGTAVIPLGFENPFRLAEDLATVDILSQGRLQPGLSVGTPINYEHYKQHLYPDTWEYEKFDKERILRLRKFLAGVPVSDFQGVIGIEEYADTIQPFSVGLAERLWYGGFRQSAMWAGENAFNFMTGNVVSAEGLAPEEHDFVTIQTRDIASYYAHHPAGDKARVSLGVVALPTDSASKAQIKKYREYMISRYERTLTAQGPRKLYYAPDLVGTSAEIAERLYASSSFQLTRELIVTLPFNFQAEDYQQMIHDVANYLGPALSWKPMST